MPKPPSTYVDDDGRVCTRCEEYKTWDKYRKERQHSTGHTSACSECLKAHERKLRQQDDDPYGSRKHCVLCNALMEVSAGGEMCDQCGYRRHRWRRGNWYLCVHDPDPARPFFGGHFNQLDMDETLEAGYFARGMRFELWVYGEFRDLFEIVGEQLTEQRLRKVTTDDYVPRGDGSFLTKAPAR